LGVAGKFLLLVGGVMGYAQDVDTIIDGARRLQHDPEIVFLLVGDGVQKERLMEKAAGLPNVRFHPFIDPREYTSLVRGVDVGIVALRADMHTPVVPSKILPYMAARKPWIGSLNVESDACTIGREAGCALLCGAGRPETFADAVLRLHRDVRLRRRMGEAGRRYCERHFSSTAAIDLYDRVLRGQGEGEAALRGDRPARIAA
jgi:glycosyltransferase involved in cell wall biosynthesis